MPKESKKNQTKPRKAAAKKGSAAAIADKRKRASTTDKPAKRSPPKTTKAKADLTVLFRAGERGVRYVGMSDSDSDSFDWIAAGLCRVGDVVYVVPYDDVKDKPPGYAWELNHPIIILPPLDKPVK